MTMISIPLRTCEVRSWRLGDLDSLVEQANNRRIWINLRDAFPHPYTRHDGRAYMRRARAASPETTFAITVEGRAIGEIGFVRRTDVERVSAEIGYWVGEAFWGRGIATDALGAITRFAIDAHALTRVYALPFARNAASCRVLEKAGYTLEGRLRRSAVKDGIILDQLLYAFIAPEGDRQPRESRD